MTKVVGVKLTQHAIISGGSSGIGLALAKKLAATGYNVTILARDAVRLETARIEIESARRDTDQRVLAISVDVVDAQAVRGGLGHLSHGEMAALDDALALVLGLPG